MNNLYKLASILYKLAVETPDWVPDDIKSFMGQIDKIEKDPRLKNFRAEIDGEIVNNVKLEIFKDNLTNKILTQYNIVLKLKSALENVDLKEKETRVNEILELLGTPSGKEPPEHEKGFHKELSDLSDQFSNFYNNLTLDGLNKNKIAVGKNVFKISKYYGVLLKKAKTLLKKINDYYNTKKGLEYLKQFDEDKRNNFLFYLVASVERIKSFPEFDQIPGKKDWDLRAKSKDNYYIVFTTDYNDILGMSSRSDWTSCQDIRPEKEIKDSSLYQQIIGSAAEPSVGIIYLTDGSQTKYGEKMVARATIWILTDKETGKDVLSIQQIYPQNDPEISAVFKEELKKHTGFDVVHIELDEKEAAEDYYANFELKYIKPYDDVGIKTKQDLVNIYDVKDELIENILETAREKLQLRHDLVKTDIVNRASQRIGPKEISYIARTHELDDLSTASEIIEKILNEECGNIINLLYEYLEVKLKDDNSHLGYYLNNTLLRIYLGNYDEEYYYNILRLMDSNTQILDDFFNFVLRLNFYALDRPVISKLVESVVKFFSND